MFGYQIRRTLSSPTSVFSVFSVVKIRIRLVNSASIFA